MKALLAKLFKRKAEPAPAPLPAPSKRRYGNNGKRRHQAPKGARRIDPNSPIIQQARGK
jgi:hypothetical protein